MTSKCIQRIVRWAVDSDLKKFAEDSYGLTGTAFDVASEGDYLRDKLDIDSKILQAVPVLRLLKLHLFFPVL